MTSKQSIPTTQNEAWGFWGTMEQHAEAAWPIAMQAIAEATGEPMDAVRIFLDSRHGRHFADQVMDGVLSELSLERAIQSTTDQWMAWQIGKLTSKDFGIPRGLPYLTGFVIHCAITEESLAG